MRFKILRTSQIESYPKQRSCILRQPIISVAILFSRLCQKWAQIIERFRNKRIRFYCLNWHHQVQILWQASLGNNSANWKIGILHFTLTLNPSDRGQNLTTFISLVISDISKQTRETAVPAVFTNMSNW